MLETMKEKSRNEPTGNAVFFEYEHDDWTCTVTRKYSLSLYPMSVSIINNSILYSELLCLSKSSDPTEFASKLAKAHNQVIHTKITPLTWPGKHRKKINDITLSIVYFRGKINSFPNAYKVSKDHMLPIYYHCFENGREYFTIPTYTPRKRDIIMPKIIEELGKQKGANFIHEPKYIETFDPISKLYEYLFGYLGLTTKEIEIYNKARIWSLFTNQSDNRLVSCANTMNMPPDRFKTELENILKKVAPFLAFFNHIYSQHQSGGSNPRYYV